MGAVVPRAQAVAAETSNPAVVGAGRPKVQGVSPVLRSCVPSSPRSSPRASSIVSQPRISGSGPRHRSNPAGRTSSRRGRGTQAAAHARLGRSPRSSEKPRRGRDARPPRIERPGSRRYSKRKTMSASSFATTSASASMRSTPCGESAHHMGTSKPVAPARLGEKRENFRPVMGGCEAPCDQRRAIA